MVAQCLKIKSPRGLAGPDAGGNSERWDYVAPVALSQAMTEAMPVDCKRRVKPLSLFGTKFRCAVAAQRARRAGRVRLWIRLERFGRYLDAQAEVQRAEWARRADTGGVE